MMCANFSRGIPCSRTTTKVSRALGFRLFLLPDGFAAARSGFWVSPSLSGALSAAHRSQPGITSAIIVCGAVAAAMLVFRLPA